MATVKETFHALNSALAAQAPTTTNESALRTLAGLRALATQKSTSDEDLATFARDLDDDARGDVFRALEGNRTSQIAFASFLEQAFSFDEANGTHAKKPSKRSAK